MDPTIGQMLWTAGGAVLLIGALLPLAAGYRRSDRRLRVLGRALTLAAVLANLGLIVYRDLLWQSRAVCPIMNNFDSVVLFVVMLGGLLFYLLTVSRRRAGPNGEPARRTAIDLVLLPPMIVGQLVGLLIALPGLDGFRQFHSAGVWRPIHLAALILGTLFLAAAAVAAVMYLILDRSLRFKRPVGLPLGLPSLERLEELLLNALLAGFILLTGGMITGAAITLGASGAEGGSPPAKVWISLLAWLIFLVVLNMRFFPRLRGRRVAWLVTVGFALLLVTYAAAQWAPR